MTHKGLADCIRSKLDKAHRKIAGEGVLFVLQGRYRGATQYNEAYNQSEGGEHDCFNSVHTVFSLLEHD